MLTRSLQGTLQKMMLAGPRLAYQQALATLDTPPHTADTPIDAPWIASVHYDGGDRRGYFAGVGVVIAPGLGTHLRAPVLRSLRPSRNRRTPDRREDLPRLRRHPSAEHRHRHENRDRVENNYRPLLVIPGPRADRRKPYADLALLRLAEPTEVDPARLQAGPAPDGTAVSCLGWPDGHRGSGMFTQINTHTVSRHAGLGGGIRPDEFCDANADKPADLGSGYSGACGDPARARNSDAAACPGSHQPRPQHRRRHDPSPAIVVDLNAHRESSRPPQASRSSTPSEPRIDDVGEQDWARDELQYPTKIGELLA
ncbi:hypothetical protein [Amycolatopsis sp. NPDC051371]|uniref:hypothetical protein n=1 Tax=Amycolatopsis sp. NPDC051371 TaxID=3155800 RepID=UPI003430DC7C